MKLNKKYILGKHVKVDGFKNIGFFGIGSRQFTTYSLDEWTDLLYIAAHFITPQNKDTRYLSEIKDRMSKEKYINYIQFLLEKNFLINTIESDGNNENRYARNYLHYQSYGANPIQVQTNLSAKHVVILGCGGIGNHVSAILATSGIKKLTLVDNDHVELTNVTRQILFKEEDINKLKTSVIKKELLLRNSKLEVDEINIKINNINSLSVLPNADIWVLSADEPDNIHLWVNKYCVDNNQAYICSGYFNDIAAFGPLYIPNKTSCLECCNPLIHIEDQSNEKTAMFSENINNNFKVATFPVANAISAAFCAGDILKYLGEYQEPLSLNRKVGIWTDELKIQTLEYPKSKTCHICGNSN